MDTTEKRTGFIPNSGEPLRAWFLELWSDGRTSRVAYPVPGWWEYTAYDHHGQAIDTYVDAAYLDTIEGAVSTYHELTAGYGRDDWNLKVAILPAGEEPTETHWQSALEDLTRLQALARRDGAA